MLVEIADFNLHSTIPVFGAPFDVNASTFVKIFGKCL